MSSFLTSSEVRAAVDIAEHNEAYIGPALVVYDGTVLDRYYGVRIEVEPANGGWCGVARNAVGQVGYCWSRSKYAAACAAYARFRRAPR